MSNTTEAGKEVKVESTSPFTSLKPGKCTVPHFADPPLPVTALASYTGAGNTWVRFLLEQATGTNYPIQQEAYRPWHNQSKTGGGGGFPIPSQMGGTPSSLRQRGSPCSPQWGVGERLMSIQSQTGGTPSSTSPGWGVPPSSLLWGIPHPVPNGGVPGLDEGSWMEAGYPPLQKGHETSGNGGIMGW